MRKYTVILIREQDSEDFYVVVPELPGCFTQGSSVEEALERSREAIAGHLFSLESNGEDPPEEPAEVLVGAVEPRADLWPVTSEAPPG